MFSVLGRIKHRLPNVNQTRSKTADEYRTGFCQSEIDHYYEIFDQFDKDRNGVLDISEFNDIIMHWTGRRMTGSTIEAVFDAADADKDDRLTFREFIDHLGQRNSRTYDEAAVRRIFKMWTPGSDNRMRFFEAKQALVYLGQQVEHPEMNRLLRKLDADKDGFLEYTEFRRLIRQEMKKLGKCT